VNQRLANHLHWGLLCPSRHTVAGLLYSGGRQFQDWSADYRLYSRGRVNVDDLFALARREVQKLLPPDAPLVAAMDDSVMPKSGQKIPGVSWRVDPQSPPFQVNFILGQRVLQLSAAVPFGGQGEARSIPLDFVEAPTAKRPGKKASKEQKKAYRELQRQKNINTVGLQRVQALEAQTKGRPLWLTVDGRFTNRTILKGLPAGVPLIGRIRRDAKVYALPPDEVRAGMAGRPRRYGERLPTPEQVLKDPTIPFAEVKAHAAGKVHTFRIKTLEAVKWKPAGAGRVMRLIVIAPLGYRLRQGGKMLYRQPAYLICSDPGLPLEQVLQAYIWRWGIEVNFRDEKSVLGVGEAQLRHRQSVQTQPAVAVAGYALLLLAGIAAYGPAGIPEELPDPKWLRGRRPRVCPTQRLLSQLRLEAWGTQITTRGFEGLSTSPAKRAATQKPPKSPTPLASAILYARRV